MAAFLDTGKQIYLRASQSFTPPFISETLPPVTCLAYRVPSNKTLILAGAQIALFLADQTTARICRRYRLLGKNVTAAPAAAAAPAVALQAHDVGMDAGTYTYKIAQVDGLGNENAASAASAAVVTVAGTLAVNVTLPALGTGGVAWRVYRTTAGGGTYFFCAEATVTPYRDVKPDSNLDQSRTPANTWGTTVSEVADAPCQLVFEAFSALAAAPTQIVYTNHLGVRSSVAIAPATALGTRLKMKLSQEGRAFLSVPTAIGNMPQDQRVSDFGATEVIGFQQTAAAIGGCWIVWGYAVMATAEFQVVPPNGAAQQMPINRPLVFPPGSEMTIDVGNTVGAANGVREIEASGFLLDV